MIEQSQVAWKTLGEVAELQRGKTITAKSVTVGEIPVISGGQKPAYFTGEFNRDGETITIAGSGAYAGFVMYWNEPIFVSDAFSIKPNENLLLTKYAYYFLLSNQMKIFGMKKGSGVPHVYSKDVATLKIPIPPISLQKEIVKILDKLTELEAALEAALEAELSLREKQYQYYRDHLLSFGDNVEWKSLGEVVEYSSTRIRYELLNENNYVGVDNLLQNRAGKTISNYVPTSGNLTQFILGDILIGNIRPYLKKIWQADCEGGTNGDVLVIRITDKDVDARYLYQVLSDDKFFEYNMKHAKGAKMPRGNKQAILQYPIPIPPLTTQQKIVEILDKFDHLTNSISEGLPKEIELRRKQYEYYRERLLTFPKQ